MGPLDLHTERLDQVPRFLYRSLRDPAEQLEAFELKLVDMLCSQASPQTARDVADKTWDLVHDRGDDDPVKQRVVECHEALARLSARSGEPPT